MPRYTDCQLEKTEPYKSILELFAKTGFIKGLTASDFEKHLKLNNPDRLNKCLKVLIKRTWLKPIGKARYYRYFITETYFYRRIIRALKIELDQWSKDILTDYIFNKNMQKEDFDNKPILWEKQSTWSIFGISPELIKVLTNMDKKMLNENIKTVVNNLEEINKMKLKYLNRAAIIRANKNHDYKTVYRLYNLGFHYFGTPLYNLETTLEESKKLKHLKK